MNERWATFDCYGTLIDWNRGIRDVLGRVFGEASADAGLRRFHDIEPALQADGRRTYREVLTEAMRARRPRVRGRGARRVPARLAGVSRGASRAGGRPGKRLAAGDPLEHRSRLHRGVHPADRCAVRAGDRGVGDRIVQAGDDPLDRVLPSYRCRPGEPRSRGGEPVPRHRARREPGAARRVDQSPRRAVVSASRPRASGFDGTACGASPRSRERESASFH